MSEEPLNPDHYRLQTLRLFRQVMPGVAGVVLSTEDGHMLTSDVDEGIDPESLAAEAYAQHLASLVPGKSAPKGASTLVHRGAGLYLVVFVPAAFALMWRANEALAPEGFAGPGPLPPGMAA